MKWFRPAGRPHHVALSMIGAKPGDRVLVAGAGDGSLAAELALVTGLNGRTLVLDTRTGARETAEAAAAEAGALLEFAADPASAVPDPDASFDVVVLNQIIGALPDGDRAGACVDAWRVLRPGGRLIAIERSQRSGLFALASKATGPAASAAEVLKLALGAGFKAARVLSESEGLVFVEATKPRGG